MDRFPSRVALLGLLACAGCQLFERAADPREAATLRIEYLHSIGGAGVSRGGESFAIERVVREGPWAGSESAIESRDLGLYRLEVVSAASGELLSAQGFCSIFGEWLTTADAREHPERRFEESLRIPEPHETACLRWLKRDAENRFATIFEADLPAAAELASPVRPKHEVLDIAVAGPTSSCVDVLFLGDGYTESEAEKFRADVLRLSASLLEREPYSRHRDRFSVRAVFAPSPASGVSRPERGIERDSALGCRYSTFSLPRYVLTTEDRRWREVASLAPYDALIILLNESAYGGGGIYNLYCVAAADSPSAPYLVAHEFGHSFAGLGDEYYTSAVAYQDFASKSVEPWEPNVTALLDPASLKWRNLVDAATVLPTPWAKDEFERSTKRVDAFREELRIAQVPEPELTARVDAERANALSGILTPRGRIGAYEGAQYEARGLYRPDVDCIMFTRDCPAFCSVCSAATDARITAITGD